MLIPETLYHISIDLEHNGVFTPRISNALMTGEDDTIPRISFAPTIEDCLSAMPFGGIDLDEFMYAREQPYFKVFKLDTKKIAEGYICDYEYLAKKELVSDALQSKEYWVLQNLKLNETDTFFIKVKGFGLKFIPIINRFDAFKILEDKDFCKEIKKKHKENLTLNKLLNLSNYDVDFIRDINIYLNDKKMKYLCYHKIIDLKYEEIQTSDFLALNSI